jgi:hypothetical protein
MVYDFLREDMSREFDASLVETSCGAVLWNGVKNRQGAGVWLRHVLFEAFQFWDFQDKQNFWVGNNSSWKMNAWGAMAQRQRVWLQIRRLGVRISLASFCGIPYLLSKVFKQRETQGEENYFISGKARNYKQGFVFW